MSLEGKTVIVTGAGRGLGKAYSEALAEEGANVVAADIRDTSNTVTRINEQGGKAIGLSLDVAKMDSCQEMADKAISQFGSIDVLINNAALYGDISGTTGVTTGITAAIGVSSEGTFVGGGSTIINFASSTGTSWNITASGGIATATVTPGVSLGLAIALGG